MSKEIKLSATRIDTFKECKYKYWCNYVEHLPKVPSPAFRLGLAVHEALELAGQIWMKKEKFTKVDEKKIMEKYEEVAIREGIQEMGIHNEGKRLVKNRVRNFALGDRILGLEIEFGFRGKENVTTADGVPLLGAIDKAVEIDEDTLLIVDYKTSKTAPTPDQMKTDPQLSIYDLVATIKWPQYKRIILGLDLLRFDMLYSYRTDKERRSFELHLKEVHKQMTEFTKKDAKPTLNTFCPWCDFKEYCDSYKKACKKSDYKFLSAVNLSADDLVAEWKDARAIKKILEERERELGMIMTEKIKKEDANLFTDTEEIYIRQSSRKNYNAEKIVKYIPMERLVKMININNKAVEEYAQENPAVQDFILESAEINFTSPFLATKKLRKTRSKEKK